MSGRLPVETAEKGVEFRLHFEQKCQQSANHLGLRGAGNEDLVTSPVPMKQVRFTKDSKAAQKPASHCLRSAPQLLGGGRNWKVVSDTPDVFQCAVYCDTLLDPYFQDKCFCYCLKEVVTYETTNR